MCIIDRCSLFNCLPLIAGHRVREIKVKEHSEVPVDVDELVNISRHLASVENLKSNMKVLDGAQYVIRTCLLYCDEKKVWQL